MQAKKRFVGIGFGPIQSALFLLEAFRSGNFGRFVVVEVDPAVVAAVRAAGGRYTVNVAHTDRIEKVTVEGVELLNPTDPADRAAAVAAIAEADELATALPSVAFYERGVSALIAEGLERRTKPAPLLIYTAENHNHAAEHLSAQLGGVSAAVVNTVIGKMSGVITDAATLDQLGLAELTPGLRRAVLVEAFNRILISAVSDANIERGIGVFVEKADLLPFEEAKLYGHNAVHAMLGYRAWERGLTTMAEARGHADLMAAARAAFIDEAGAGLVRKHGGLGDELFTPAGMRAYAEDLLERMTNPWLHDLVARVVRDPERKLGYDDRLFVAMRVALAGGVRPMHLARGLAGARAAWVGLLGGRWGAAGGDGLAEGVVEAVWGARDGG